MTQTNCPTNWSSSRSLVVGHDASRTVASETWLADGPSADMPFRSDFVKVLILRGGALRRLVRCGRGGSVAVSASGCDLYMYMSCARG